MAISRNHSVSQNEPNKQETKISSSTIILFLHHFLLLSNCYSLWSYLTWASQERNINKIELMCLAKLNAENNEIVGTDIITLYKQQSVKWGPFE
jgi:hypothetical protein